MRRSEKDPTHCAKKKKKNPQPKRLERIKTYLNANINDVKGASHYLPCNMAYVPNGTMAL